jgi:hypothetical protein
VIKKTFLLILILFAASFSQSVITVSGVVKSSRTSGAIEGATVKLLKMGGSGITDADGKFNISVTSVIKFKKLMPVSDINSLVFDHVSNGVVNIRIVDLSGKQQAVIHTGKLDYGVWKVVPPELSQGVYVCLFESQQEKFAVCFISTENNMRSNGEVLQNQQSNVNRINNNDLLNKETSAVKPVDTLLVTKNGYSSSRISINSYNVSGLTINLDDSSAAQTENALIVPDPSWTCYMPEGIPPPKSGVAVFSIILQYSACHNVGLTQFGQRRQFDIKGGTIKGEKLNADILSGGLDYELTLSNGSVEVEQINIFKTKDNTSVLMRNAGVAPIGEKNVRVVLDFEAPNSSSSKWLHTGKYIATRIIDSSAKTITLDVFDVSSATLPSQKIQIKDPSGVPNQTWECFKLTGSKGTEVFTENVSLGSSISIGASKRGSRNIIPITGSTTSGRVSGKILSGGADYQLGGLDARYTLAPSDTDFIIVRNCGSNGLVPVFETKVNGKYAFLNETKYLSSSPEVGGGGVKITFYEVK